MKPYLLFLLLLPSFAMAQTSHSDVSRLVLDIGSQMAGFDDFGLHATSDISRTGSMAIEISHVNLKHPIKVLFDFDREMELESIRVGQKGRSSKSVDASHIAEKIKKFYRKAGNEMAVRQDFSQETFEEYRSAIDELHHHIMDAFKTQITDSVKGDFKSRLNLFLHSWGYPVMVVAGAAFALHSLNFETYAGFKGAVLAAIVFAAAQANAPIRAEFIKHFEAKRKTSRNRRQIEETVRTAVARTHSTMLTHCVRAMRARFLNSR